MPNHENITPSEQQENNSFLKLSNLDVKGREIAGLEPKIEKFSPLEIGRDIDITQQMENITSNIDLRSAFVFINPKYGSENRLVEAPHWRTSSTAGPPRRGSIRHRWAAGHRVVTNRWSSRS
jgi:hypothetical protein